LRWSRRTTTTISQELSPLGISASPNTVARLLHHMGYSLRVNHKQISTSVSPDRNLQFEYLAHLRDRFQRGHLPIVSVDSKKRELVGNFKNPGYRWECAPRRVYDHDFRTDSSGVAIPYGIYDVPENRGALVVGVSHDTPAFAAHAMAHWWRQEGSQRYARSRELLILADTGGCNGYRCYAWKTELQSQLANSFALAVTVAHYPAGASKWNPIEHRLFSEISRNWAGEPLDSYQKILNTRARREPKPVSKSRPTSTAATTRVASSPPQNRSCHSDCTVTKRFRTGTTPSNPKCEVVSARPLRFRRSH
jgi:hypothetical protein